MRITKLYPVLIALLIALLVLSACGATATPAVPTAEPTTAPPTGETGGAGTLTANPWQWVSFTDPLQQFDVETPERYLLAFNEEGTVAIVADCNNARGSYTEDAGSLTIEVGPMTKAACPPESRSDEFVQNLGFAVRYFFEGDTLYVDLMADGGTMAFAPADAELMADDGEGAMAGEAESAGDVTSYPWLWTSFTSPVEQFEVQAPEDYVVTFNDDGTVNITADCNQASGSYTVDGGSLTIEIGPMTMAACPPESRSDQFVTLLGNAALYFFEDAQLYIDLFADGGTMVFAPEGEAELAAGGGGAQAEELPAELVAQLDAYLQSQVWTEGGNPEGAAPGLVLLVDTPEGRYLNAAGVSSIEDGTPMQADDILEIGSNTKSMTIVLLMQLQEEGVLSMDDMLSDWLPDLAARIPNGEQVTLRQMANMATGFWDYADELMESGTSDREKLVLSYEPVEMVEYAIENGTPDFAPGEGFKYSNTNYILLGMIIEKAAGQTLADLYQQRIFDPLGMETAVFIEGVPQAGEITTQGYWWNDDGSRVNTTDWNGSQGWAAGAAAMTAEDLLIYGKALGQGELFENPDSLAQMLPFNDAARLSLGGRYGLGLMELADGYFGHGGQTLGFESIWYTNPDEGITVVGLTNSATYPSWNLINVLNIVDGEGAKPFGPLTLLPVGDDVQGIFGDAVASRWEWVQMADESDITGIAPGAILLLLKDGSAKVKSEACGEAAGTFAVDPSWQIGFDLDASGITCDSGEPAAQLLGFLDSADTWRFENGRLVIALDGGATLLFEVAAAG